MSRANSPIGFRRLLAPLTVCVLAVSVLLLVVFALRSPTIADAGSAPGPVPTWDPGAASRSATATPSPSESPDTSAVADPRLLSVLDAKNFVRATRGNCSTITPSVELSGDGGFSWTQLSLGENRIGEVLSLDYEDDSQITMVVKTLPSCETTVLTSYTDGQYWAPYPDRVAARVFPDTAAAIVHLRGAQVSAPCEMLVDVISATEGVAALCESGSFFRVDSTSGWTDLPFAQALAIASRPDSTELLAVTITPSCDFLGVAASDAADLSKGAREVGCVPGAGTRSQTTLATEGQVAVLWSGDVTHVSTDGGVNWIVPSN